MRLATLALLLLLLVYGFAGAIDARPLRSAVEAGDSALVEELLQQTPAMITEVLSGQPVLHWTSDPEMIRLLVSHHADISARNSEGLTPIETAAQRGDLAALEALQPREGDLNVLSPSAQFPLAFGISAESNREAVVKFLLSNGANPNLSSGLSTLWMAVTEGDARVIGLLLDHGANFYSLNGQPILAAVRSTNLDLLKFLLERGKRVDPEFQFDERSLLFIVPGPYPTGSLAPAEEVRKYDRATLPAVQFLIQNGADKNAFDSGEYVLDLAEKNGLVSIAAYLRKIGAISQIERGKNCNVEPHTGIRAFPPKERNFAVYHCPNNVWDCEEPVRQALRDAKTDRWGPFDFLCFEGRIAKIYVSTASAIRADWLGFINSNPRMFKLGSNPEFQLERGDHGRQIYKGLLVNHGIRRWESKGAGQYGDENWVEFFIGLTDTRGWQFSPQFLVGRDEAIEIAKNYFEPRRPKEISEWKIEVSSFIRPHAPKGSDCPQDPAAVWYVQGNGQFAIPGVGNPFGKSMEALVDARSGKPCSFSGTGEEYRRRK